MGHPQIENKTPFAFEALYLFDEEFRPLLVPVIKGTFTVGRDGRCEPSEEQVPLDISGKYWGENPDISSYRYEPEVAFAKPATDVVLVGHAYATRRDQTQMSVSLRVGKLQKELAIFGDRVWMKSLGSISMTKPVAFEKMPLIYERAFGGWDRDDADPCRHTFESRNPVGTGFRSRGNFVEGIRLPNIEDPRATISSLSDKPAPAGVGFVSPHWQPRAALAGTFDQVWSSTRSPLLPIDFDRRHMNAASDGLVASGYLRGDEPVDARGVTRDGRLTFSLPAVMSPSAQVVRSDGQATLVELVLDTVIIEPDDLRVVLFWRGQLVLRTGPHDVRSIEISHNASRES